MSLKLFAIGNRIMGDDAIAIHIAEILEKSIEELGVEIIVGETDFEYCLSKIKEEDYIIIVDSTYLGIKPGEVTVNSLKDIGRLNCNNSLFSQHSYSLIGIIQFFYNAIDGIVIGIEGSQFDFSLSLSKILEESLEEISIKVKEMVVSLLRKGDCCLRQANGGFQPGDKFASQ
jgi:hydrogenase maturation protease